MINDVKQAQIQEFPHLFESAQENDYDYEVHDSLLYSIKRPANNAPWYTRLVLPKSYRWCVTDHCHSDVGHMGARNHFAEFERHTYMYGKGYVLM